MKICHDQPGYIDITTATTKTTASTATVHRNFQGVIITPKME